ncbi:MAG: hypothetical protein EOP85_09415 [Verrucomicrobiaceae bacterium]|nr:MAG: hypothetical protein EOP85_09415 [Verrucomicrobiaceae bacterium]
MSEPEDEFENPNYWPGISDLFLTLFIISIGIVAVVFVSLLPKNNVGDAKSLVVAVGHDMEKVRDPVNRMREELDLPLIEAGSRPNGVIAALDETTVTVVERIRSLDERRAELDGMLSRLDEDGGAAREIRRMQEENDRIKQQLDRVEKELAELTDTLKKAPDTVGKLVAENQDLKRQLHDKPPIIQISEQKQEYRFGSGSSTMSEAFVAGLRTNEFARLSGEIIARQQEGRVKVDTLEIIGHTDGIAISRKGNLDEALPDVLAGGSEGMPALVPGSNNDLGLLRALSVRDQWLSYIATRPEHAVLAKIHVRCYSAGQTILPKQVAAPASGNFRSDDPSARRIEMRLTRLGGDP